jgi:hypothetical protein
MPDEFTAPGQAGQGGTTAPAETGGQGDIDYARAYSELRPEYTRTTQELAQYRDTISEYEGLFEALHDSDPEVQAAAMEALGLEPAVGSPEPGRPQEDEFEDPLEKEVQELRAWRDEVQAAREQDAAQRDAQELETLRDDYIGEAIGLIEEATQRKFKEQEEEVLGNLAIAMTGDDGLPDVRGAFERLYGSDGILEINRSQWIDNKAGAAQAPLGTTIPADRKPRSGQDRIAWADERWAQMERQQ